MRLQDYHPHWVTADPRQVIDEIGSENLALLIPTTAEYYEKTLPLWRVLTHYGCEGVGPNDETAYVPCKLPSHGGEDRNASARYFTQDRETGEFKPAFYCYKCQKRLGAFWYTYIMERDLSDRNLRDTYKFIYDTFQVPPPIDLWCQFDPTQMSFDDNATTETDPTPHFEAALAIRAIKQVDPHLYLTRLKALLASGTVSAPVSHDQ